MAERAFFVRMCRRWLSGYPDDVEDVLSHGALKAIRYIRRHPGAVRRFRPWALRLLYNLCVDRMRSRGRLTLLGDDDDPVTHSPLGLPAAPDHEVFRGELGVALEQAIARLSPRLRTTFELRFHEALSYPEIAARLDISQDNARKRIQQARATLRGELSGFVLWSVG